MVVTMIAYLIFLFCFVAALSEVADVLCDWVWRQWVWPHPLYVADLLQAGYTANDARTAYVKKWRTYCTDWKFAQACARLYDADPRANYADCRQEARSVLFRDQEGYFVRWRWNLLFIAVGECLALTLTVCRLFLDWPLCAPGSEAGFLLVSASILMALSFKLITYYLLDWRNARIGQEYVALSALSKYLAARRQGKMMFTVDGEYLSGT